MTATGAEGAAETATQAEEQAVGMREGQMGAVEAETKGGDDGVDGGAEALIDLGTPVSDASVVGVEGAAAATGVCVCVCVRERERERESSLCRVR